MSSILFILGPSGVGKSTLAAYFAAEMGWLHLEIDQFPCGDGIDLADLRTEWDSFLNSADAGPLSRKIQELAKQSPKKGAILSFPGNLRISLQHIQNAASAGILVIVLYGSKAQCLEAFLRREAETGRRLGEEHWVAHNEAIYAWLYDPALAPYLFDVFTEHGRHRSGSRLLAEIKARLGS